jgi:uncharacterized membrane protein YdbT with pleckstrin-like domain
MTGERSVWQGTPSQIINLPQYLLWLAIFGVLIVVGMALWDAMVLNLLPPLLWALCALAAVPLFVIAWKWLVLANTRYELTTQRLRTRTGVLNRHFEELELYRVRDYRLEQPLHLRLFSLSNLTLETSDKSHRHIVLRAVRGGQAMREDLRTHVEEARARRGVRELDVE